MTERYPDMVEKIHIGSSYEKYPLYVLKVWEEPLIFQLRGGINSPVVLGITWNFFFGILEICALQMILNFNIQIFSDW